MTPRLIEAYSRLPKLVSQLHLPVQSGSDRVLAAMKRGYTVLEFKSIVRRLRAARPDLSLSSDFIVGFPGETEADFEATMRLIDDIGFDGSFSFLYSARPGTPAADLQDDTPHEVKAARLARLQRRIDEQAHAASEAMVGTRAAHPGRGRVEEKPGRVGWSDRQQSRGEFRRPAAADRPVHRCHHFARLSS